MRIERTEATKSKQNQGQGAKHRALPFFYVAFQYGDLRAGVAQSPLFNASFFQSKAAIERGRL